MLAEIKVALLFDFMDFVIAESSLSMSVNTELKSIV